MQLGTMICPSIGDDNESTPIHTFARWRSVARPGLSLRTADEVDRAGIKVAVAQGSAPDGFLTRTLKNAEIVLFQADLLRRVRRWPVVSLMCMARTSILRLEFWQSCQGQ